MIDMTGDGLLDLVGNGRTSTISATQSFLVFPGNGDGTFDPAVITAPARPVFDIGTLDADAILDVVSSDAFGNVVLLAGLGNGDFAAEQPIGTLGLDGFNDAVRAVAVVDATGDGNLDVAVMRRRGMSVLAGNGDGTFAASIDSTTALTIDRNTLFTADLNSDSRTDFLVPRADGLHLLLANADGSILEAGGVGSPPVGLDHRIASGDFDENGTVDLAIITNQNTVGFVGQLLVFLGNGDGSFAAATRVAVDDFGDVRTVDFDGDGHLDLVTAGLHEAAIHVGVGDGTFRSAIRFDLSGPQTSFPTDILVGDVNGDGRADIIGYAFFLPQNAPAMGALLTGNSVEFSDGAIVRDSTHETQVRPHRPEPVRPPDLARRRMWNTRGNAQRSLSPTVRERLFADYREVESLVGGNLRANSSRWRLNTTG
jgi:hypothetical protein